MPSSGGAFNPEPDSTQQEAAKQVSQNKEHLTDRSALSDSSDAVSPLTASPDHGPWTREKNMRRCELIDKEIAGTITEAEKCELDGLQEQAISYRDRVAPLPIKGARKLHQELLKNQHSGSQG